MTAFVSRTAVSATALLLALSAPAFAAVTAQQVWDDWKAQMALYGQGDVTTGSETYQNGVLTVTDLGFDVTGEDGSSARGTLPELRMTENGDGTVTVTMSEDYPISISTPADAETGAKASEVDLALRHTGLAITVSGEPDALTYAVQAGRYALELDRVTEDGAEVPAELTLAFNDVSGTYSSTVAAARDVTYKLAAAGMDLLVDMTNPDDGSHVMLSGKVKDVTTDATVTMPLEPSADPNTMLVDGLAVKGGYTTGGGAYMFEVTDATGPTSGTFTTESSATKVNLSKDQMAYDATATGVALQATSASMPLPISVNLAEYGLKFQMPMSKTAAPAPWALGVNLSGLALNDEIWGMFDPQSVLPRDPATLMVDLTGTASLFYDIADPAQSQAMQAAAVPGQIDSVTLNGLEVSIGGASVTGSGAFTLDNADTTTFQGMPKPVGSVDLQLNGVNGLIDKLVQMGLLPEDQAMVPRMMLGGFTTSVGDDQLTSKIEFTPDGQLLANGQRLQ